MHPTTQAAQLPDELLRAVQNNCLLTAKQLEQERAAWCAKWYKRCLELQEDEKKLMSVVHPEVQCILSPKNLLVWKEIGRVADSLQLLLMGTGFPEFKNSFVPPLNSADRSFAICLLHRTIAVAPK